MSPDARLCDRLREMAPQLERDGHVVIPDVLRPEDCVELAARFDDPAQFRATVHMQRHGFGQGEYRYFRYPLPAPVQALRSRAYAPLSALANRWNQRLGRSARFPPEHAQFLAHCHAQGQLKPTPLLLRYGPGDYNRLHQDLYGAEVFPLQIAILLSAPERDFHGGEFVITEQTARMQSRPIVVPLRQGDAVVFAVRDRPQAGRRGEHRVQLRHGVSAVRSGRRLTLGVIFHDAA